MLNIINGLEPFFEDCYRRIHIREYSRKKKKSAPTSSKLLAKYEKLNLIKIEKDKNYYLYYANKDSRDFIDLSRIYWRNRISKITKKIEHSLVSPTIILFGSISKAENKNDSDIDLCILSKEKKIDLKEFEKKLKRKIQILFFDSIDKIKNKELKNNILSGYILTGRIR